MARTSIELGNGTSSVTVLHDWFGWDSGAVLTNLIASALWVPIAWILALRHLHCVERGCYRPATVPVPNTVHKVCKKHAEIKGHTH